MKYKFCAPTEYSLQNLADRQLFCRHYDDFNDPFEFWSRVAEGIPSREQPDRFQAALAAWGFPDPDNAEPHEEYFESLTDSQPAFQLLFDHTRITCFCADSSNLLMWSHYADGLRGFCIGFNDEALITVPRTDFFTEVEYVDAPPLVDSFLYAVAEDQFDYHMMVVDGWARHLAYSPKDPIPKEEYQRCADEAFDLLSSIWRRAFAAKPRQWEYENEYRLLIRNFDEGRAPVFREYPADAVKEIIIGERMNRTYRTRLIEAWRKTFPSASLLRATRAREHFTLDLEPIQD